MNLRPLSLTEIREIIRKHPAPFLAICTAAASTAEEASRVATDAFIADPNLLTSVAAAGMGLEEDQVAKLGLIKWIAAAAVLTKTSAHLQADDLIQVLYEEVAHYCVPGETVQ